MRGGVAVTSLLLRAPAIRCWRPWLAWAPILPLSARSSRPSSLWLRKVLSPTPHAEDNCTAAAACKLWIGSSLPW